jgi:hypothetical protein
MVRKARFSSRAGRVRCEGGRSGAPFGPEPTPNSDQLPAPGSSHGWVRALAPTVAGIGEGDRAALAWRTLSWLLRDSDAAVWAELRRAFDACLTSQRPSSTRSIALRHLGRLDPSEQYALDRATLYEVVRPARHQFLNDDHQRILPAVGRRTTAYHAAEPNQPASPTCAQTTRSMRWSFRY